MHKRICLLLCLAITLVLFPKPVFADQTTAKNITSRCSVTECSGQEVGFILDGNILTGMELAPQSGQYWEVAVSLSEQARSLYLQWGSAPGEWTLAYDIGDGGGFCHELLCGTDGYLDEYIALPDGVQAFRIIRTDGSSEVFKLLELKLYTDGVLPDYVHIWEPTPTTAELMVISTHQDDELLFFGGTIPYYAVELGLDTAVVYVTSCGANRLHEALNGLWKCGVRQYPVFLMFPDIKSKDIEKAMKDLDSDEVTLRLTEQLLRYRPQVVVSHDVNGEYGHGQHMLTVACLRKALSYAEDTAYINEHFSAVQPWSVRKCYLHMWEKDRIFIDWNQLTMTKMGNISAAQAANLGYSQHKSQHGFYQHIFIGGRGRSDYDSRDYGLYRTTVGKDNLKNDFFENISLRITSAIPKALPDDSFTPLGSRGDMCRSDRHYLRYGVVDGMEGWFYCDRTGALLEPIAEYAPEAVEASGGTLTVPAAEPTPPSETQEQFSRIKQSSADIWLWLQRPGNRIVAIIFAFSVVTAAILSAVISLTARIRNIRRSAKSNKHDNRHNTNPK